AIWSVLPPTGRYQMAAVVHDFLYWDQSCTREQADDLLRVAMAESQVDPKQRDIIWRSVRTFGHSAWAAECPCEGRRPTSHHSTISVADSRVSDMARISKATRCEWRTPAADTDVNGQLLRRRWIGEFTQGRIA